MSARDIALGRRVPARRGRQRLASLLGLCLSLGAMVSERPARAQDGATAPPGAPAGERLTRAKDLFEKGYALLQAGDCERALALFKRSLNEAKSSSSTMNAAYCLNELDRPGEALDLYDDLLTIYAKELDEGTRATVVEAVRELRKKVGSVEISASVEGGQVTIDGRPRGSLPLEAPIRVASGEHVVEILKEGYEPFERRVSVAAGATIGVVAELNVRRPVVISPPPRGGEKQPSPQPYAFFSAFGSYAIGGSMNSAAEIDRCSLSCLPVGGPVVGLRSGYRFGFGMALELSLGYMALISTFSREKVVVFRDANKVMSKDVEVRYEFDDDLRMRGPFLGMGTSYSLPLGPSLSLLGRATVGLASTRSTDSISGKARTDINEAKIVVSGRRQVLLSQPAFIMPELGVEARFGRAYVGALVGIVFITSDGPGFGRSEVGVAQPSCTDATPLGSVGCAPNQPLLSGENAYGRLSIWVPQIAAGYSF